MILTSTKTTTIISRTAPLTMTTIYFHRGLMEMVPQVDRMALFQVDDSLDVWF